MSKTSQLSHLLNGAAISTLISASAILISAPASAQSASSAETDNGGDIIVTARGREETLIEVPVSVSVLSQEELEGAGVSDIENLSDYTPGFKFENTDGQAGGRSSSAITFRGVKQQAGGAASRTGAIFYDGSYISQGAGVVQPIDLERIEVIKGPQNAQFARNTFSGAVNFVPRLPGDELEMSGQLEVSIGTGKGEQVSYRGVAAIGGPITDSIGLRVATTYERVGADYEYQNGDPNGQEDNYSVFGTAVFDVTDNFQVKATGFYVDAKDTANTQSVNATVAPGDCNLNYNGAALDGINGIETPFSTDLSQSLITTFCGQIPDASVLESTTSGQLLPGTAITGPITGFTNLLPDGLGSEYRVWKANLSFDYETAGGHNIKALASLGKSDLVGFQDIFFGESGNPAAPSFFSFPIFFANVTKDKFFEARFVSNKDKRLRFEIGASYYNQEYRNATTFDFGDFQDNKAFGIFGTIDFDITDSLTVSAEGRWVDDTQSLLDSTESTVDENSYQDFMPRVILSYSPNPDFNIYASWSQSSLNSVVTNAATLSMLDPVVLPDPSVFGNFTGVQKLTSYEIGLKQKLSSWLSYSLAAYYMEWSNQPFSNTFVVPGGALQSLNLDGDSKYKGIDFEFALKPTDGLQIFGSVAWVDAELSKLGAAGSISNLVLCPSAFTSTDICTAFSSVATLSGSGNPPANVAEWSGAIGASYSIPISGGEAYVRTDAIYQGSRFVDNFAYNKIGSNWRVNLRAGADISENFRFEAFVENLFQDDTLLTASPIGLTFGPTGGGGTKAFSSLPNKREVGFRVMLDF